MKREIKNTLGSKLSQAKIPANAVRDYITDMLAELCTVAKQDEQEDLHLLLKITHQAARNAADR